MTKIKRPTGLIAYDTDAMVKGRACGTPVAKPRLLRPRTVIYFAVIAICGGAMLFQLATRASSGITLRHDRTPLFVTLADGSIRNAYSLRILNKRPETRLFALTVDGPPGARIEVVNVSATADWRPVVSVDPDTTREVRVLVTVPRASLHAKSTDVILRASDLFVGEVVLAKDHFFAPE